MGTLGGFAPPFGPPPASSPPLAALGLTNPSRDGTPPAKPAGSPRAPRPNTAKPPWLSTRAARILSEAG